jgi:hypothetical protein
MIRARFIPHRLRGLLDWPYRLGVSPDQLSTWAHSTAPVTAAGFMDVRDRHPSLLAVERLVEEINRQTIGKESALLVCVQAGFDLSSFGIHVTARQDWAAKARGFLPEAMPRRNDALKQPSAARTWVDNEYEEQA